MQLDTSNNLNWDEATVLNFNFLAHLALMLNERTNRLGFNTQIDIGASDSFNINNYEPNGFFRFQQLYDIYVFTLFIGQNYYFNEANLSNDSFKNGKRVKHFSYTLDQLSQIANFDFSANPLIPNQRLDYYNKFLKPLYLLLKEYKKIWINAFVGKNESKLVYGYNDPLSAYVTKYNIKQEVTGQDRLDYYSFEHAVTEQKTATSNYKLTFLGGVMNTDYQMFYSFGYQRKTTIPGETIKGTWSLVNAQAQYNYDTRPGATPGEPGLGFEVFSVSYTAVANSDRTLTWSISDGVAQTWNYEDDEWTLATETKYQDDPDLFIVSFPPPETSWTSKGRLSINWYNSSESASPTGGTVTCTLTLTDSYGYLNATATVTLQFVEDPNGQDEMDTPSHEATIPEYDYAGNFEGLKFNYYAVVPSSQIQCPIPLVPGGTYDLYMYSFTSPIGDEAGDNSVHEKVINAFEAPVTPIWNYSRTYISPSPLILLQPYGNFIKVDSGTINYNFNYFNISLPSIMPYTNTIFSDYPVKMMGSVASYQQVDYLPYNYDPTIWSPNGSTPSKSWDGQRDLTPGVYLSYIGPRAELQTSRRGCYIEWWYKPLLIVSYESIFQYN